MMIELQVDLFPFCTSINRRAGPRATLVTHTNSLGCYGVKILYKNALHFTIRLRLQKGRKA